MIWAFLIGSVSLGITLVVVLAVVIGSKIGPQF